jgi:SP family general alpha glucoside:H+ symporter-like MFS transporter
MSKLHETGSEHLEHDHINEKGQYGHNDVLRDEELLNEAYRAENAEHQMGLWEAFKIHKLACLYAFLMAFTIVSLCQALHSIVSLMV